MAKESVKTIAENRRARHEFFIEETYETGIVLTGTEVKSLRLGKTNLQDSYAAVEKGELFLFQMHISPYDRGNRYNVDAKRVRKLLMHKSEISRLFGKVQQKGLTLVPLKLYFKQGKVKLELALARGKKLYDKRDAEAEKDARRTMERAMRNRFDD